MLSSLDDDTPLIDWHPSMASGLDEIDAQHKELVDLANDFFRAVQGHEPHDVLHDYLRSLHAKVRLHFEYEERIMAERCSDGEAAHKDAHDLLLEELKETEDRFSDGAFDDIEDLLAGTLKYWLVDHIQRMDTKI